MNIDDAIENVLGEMRLKHPDSRPTPGARFSEFTKRRSRDYDIHDREARRGKPMRIVGYGTSPDTPISHIILPRGVDLS